MREKIYDRSYEDMIWRSEVVVSSSGSCPVAGIIVRGAAPSDSATTTLVWSEVIFSS